MYLPTDQACNAANGLQVPTSDLTACAAELAQDSSLIDAANKAWASLLTRNPSDFYGVAPMVAKDVAAVNEETGVTRGGLLAGKGGTRSPLAGNGGSAGGSAPSCDVSSSGGCNVVPLNGPGNTSLPLLPNSQPAPMRTAPINPGLGRVGDRRSVHTSSLEFTRRFARVPAVRPRGIGNVDCCTDLPAWGDAFINGGPSISPVQSVLNWIEQNPWLAAGLAALGVAVVAGSKKGKRGR